MTSPLPWALQTLSARPDQPLTDPLVLRGRGLLSGRPTDVELLLSAVYAGRLLSRTELRLRESSGSNIRVLRLEEDATTERLGVLVAPGPPQDFMLRTSSAGSTTRQNLSLNSGSWGCQVLMNEKTTYTTVERPARTRRSDITLDPEQEALLRDELGNVAKYAAQQRARREAMLRTLQAVSAQIGPDFGGVHVAPSPLWPGGARAAQLGSVTLWQAGARHLAYHPLCGWYAQGSVGWEPRAPQRRPQAHEIGLSAAAQLLVATSRAAGLRLTEAALRLSGLTPDKLLEGQESDAKHD